MTDVVNTYKARLCRKLALNETALSSLAVGFEGKKFIGRQDVAEVQHKKGMDGAIFLLNLVCDKIDELGYGCLKTVFQVLKEENHISDIVQEMKEAHSPTPALAQCSLHDGVFQVFISYRWNKEQKEFVDNLSKDLKKGIPHIKVWKDDEGGVDPGEIITPEMKSGIESSDLFLCVLSTDYFQSENCKIELRHASELRKTFFPIEWVGRSRFSLPPEFQSVLGNMLRHKYDPEAINENAEARKCVNKVIAAIDGIKSTSGKKEVPEAEHQAPLVQKPPSKKPPINSKDEGCIPETVHEIQDLRRVLEAGTYKLAAE